MPPLLAAVVVRREPDELLVVPTRRCLTVPPVLPARVGAARGERLPEPTLVELGEAGIVA